jgi:tetratricopeptide (TPR) repeat protein
MVSPGATPVQLTRAEKVLRAALAKLDRPIVLVQALADLQSWREQYDEAEQLYRESLMLKESALALNNLALLLALRGKGGNEPVELIEKALNLVGQDASLLDSRATINLALGSPQMAATDLKVAISKRPSALNYFHQAQVASRLGQKEAARESLSKASELGLQPEDLHPLERQSFRQLQQELR